ncbi:MAG TPA: SDR family NAD(P)-dependent oxidoreductase [Polyangiaceae bacterium]|nr:SDR family NAD(P)-dependent oxidoreductase [Polyangiaceae bacterium]
MLVTGTTSGIGRALLEYYEQSGALVIAVNRRHDPELEQLYPAVRFECVDVRSTEEVARLVRGLTESAQLPNVFILNAGINQVDNDESFDLGNFRAVIETNLFGVLNFVQPLTELPVGRGARHVVAISSMANYVGNPYGLGYTTSKRALTTCFEVWARMYSGTDLVFQRVMLGPVSTAIFTMEDRLPGWMVWTKRFFSGSVDETARAIAQFARTRRERLFYPWRAVPLYFALCVCQALFAGFFRGRKTLAGNPRRSERPAWPDA